MSSLLITRMSLQLTEQWCATPLNFHTVIPSANISSFNIILQCILLTCMEDMVSFIKYCLNKVSSCHITLKVCNFKSEGKTHALWYYYFIGWDCKITYSCHQWAVSECKSTLSNVLSILTLRLYCVFTSPDTIGHYYIHTWASYGCKSNLYKQHVDSESQWYFIAWDTKGFSHMSIQQPSPHCSWNTNSCSHQAVPPQLHGLDAVPHVGAGIILLHWVKVWFSTEASQAVDPPMADCHPKAASRTNHGRHWGTQWCQSQCLSYLASSRSKLWSHVPK